MKLKFLILALTYVTVNSQITYHDFKVYRVIPNSEEQVAGLVKIQASKGIEFWDEKFVVNSDVRIMVAPERQESFEKELKDIGLDGHMVINDVQDLINKQLKSAPVNRGDRQNSFGWESYHTLTEIYDWLDEIAAANPDIVELVNMGKSFQQNDIKGVIIDHRRGARTTNYIGMIEGGIHAREWISPATVTWIINEFIRSSDPDINALARNIVWHIFPVVNPDGYVYSFTDMRMWRKNRNTDYYVDCGPNVNSNMSNGVDLNRNFDFAWNTVGASDDPCSGNFAGSSPVSEPEAIAISNYVMNLPQIGEFIYYLSFHSYTQLILLPHSHVVGADVLKVDNFGDLFEIGAFAAEAIRKKYNTDYRVGVAGDLLLYKMSGASVDWVKNETSVPICYLYELRDLGIYGFLLPPEQIMPTNLEIMDGLVEMDRIVRQMGYYRGGASSVIVSFTILVFSIIFGILFK